MKVAASKVGDHKSAFLVERILGIDFFNGTAEQAVAKISTNRGLLVAPSGTCFERFLEDDDYRRALLTADVVLPDSGLMVSLWRLLQHQGITRISGLAYLKELLTLNGLVRGQTTCWIVPNEQSLKKLLAWSTAGNFGIDPSRCYVAPIYPRAVQDEKLLPLIEAQRPTHVVIAIGAGAQEKLGWFLRENASYHPAIHCIGGALGFLTGDQVSIPDWADRLFLGWLRRLLAQPTVFIPRLWKARLLPYLIFKYGQQLPPLNGAK